MCALCIWTHVQEGWHDLYGAQNWHILNYLHDLEGSLIKLWSHLKKNHQESSQIQLEKLSNLNTR